MSMYVMYGFAQARRRVIAVTTVDRWPPERIEGHAALTQRIQVGCWARKEAARERS